ncbi:hypothetical protein SO802_017544 [Lithocarpus litseifolius]|uniref:DUF4219 domain-containing protein n=1 Tax=Lithocarpus litseifolius TaxID=425828 RepID=A0AAW2CIL6_9ROSI
MPYCFYYPMSLMMTVKLDYGNYIIWKHQIKVILETYSMIDVIDDSIIAPDHYLKDSSGNFTTEKGTDSIDDYFQKIKQVCDKHTIVLVFLDDEELLHIAPNGLPFEYNSFSSVIWTRSDVLSIKDLNTLLNAEERVIKKRSYVVDPNLVALAMNF